jgi:hypothetical protein
MKTMATVEESIRLAEEAIQRILHDLEVDIGGDIESVDVDTRQFAQLRVSIFTSVDDHV